MNDQNKLNIKDMAKLTPLQYEIEKTRDALEKHADEDDQRFKHIIQTLDTIKNNHLHHIEIDMAVVKKDIEHMKEIFAEIKEFIHIEMENRRSDRGQGSSIEWNTWATRLIIGVIVTGVLTAVLAMVLT